MLKSSCVCDFDLKSLCVFDGRRSFSMLFTIRPVRPRAIWPPHFERNSAVKAHFWDSKKPATYYNIWRPPLSLRSRKRKLQLKLPHASEASFREASTTQEPSNQTPVARAHNSLHWQKPWRACTTSYLWYERPWCAKPNSKTDQQSHCSSSNIMNNWTENINAKHY